MTIGSEMRSNLRLAALVVAGIVILALVVIGSGASPAEALAKLWESAFGNPAKTSSTLRETCPLLFAGLAVYIALKAGLFNIGVEGQITIGAICASLVAIRVPGLSGLLLSIGAGVLGGALWALPAGLIKAYRGGHEVISTIMLNNIASGLTMALVAGPFKDPSQEGTTTRDVLDSTRIPDIFQGRGWLISASLPLGILVIVAFAIWLKKSVAGFELRMVGDNPRAAEFAGIDVPKTIWRSMVASGAVAGLGGAIQVLAFEHRFFHGISSGYGFDALGVALLSGSNPIGMLGSGLLFGVLNKGASSLQILGIPKGITWIVLAMLVVVFAAIRYRKAAQSA